MTGPTTMTNRDRMVHFEQQAEQAYTKMYDAASHSDATARYSDAKEALYATIGIARELGEKDSLLRLEARLAEIKAIFRSSSPLTRARAL
jgi:hypothetical protein